MQVTSSFKWNVLKSKATTKIQNVNITLLITGNLQDGSRIYQTAITCLYMAKIAHTCLYCIHNSTRWWRLAWQSRLFYVHKAKSVVIINLLHLIHIHVYFQFSLQNGICSRDTAQVRSNLREVPLHFAIFGLIALNLDAKKW